ncbi:MAG: hypothetical protein ACXWUX_08820 [Allosphingosinicella sp.]
MRRQMIATATAVGLCLASIAPLAAQDHRHDAPRGATATVNVRVPLGARGRAARPSWGLTAGYGQAAGTAPDGSRAVREWRVAELRFDADGLRRAEVATFDLARRGSDRRLYLEDEANKKTWLIGLLLLLGAGAGLIVLLDDDGESELEVEEPGPTPGPG